MLLRYAPRYLLVALLAGALSGCGDAARSDPDPPPPVVSPQADQFRSTRTHAVVAVPVRLRIPAAHVNTPLQPRGRAPDGTIALPTGPDIAGWYADGVRPGQPGPAVMLGHVDWHNGTAVFFYLSQLRRGDVVYVDRADGSTVRFRVDSLTRVPKSQFPRDLIYRPTLAPSLRLVTCGGSFDRATRNYRDNVIVFAVPDENDRPPAG